MKRRELTKKQSRRHRATRKAQDKLFDAGEVPWSQRRGKGCMGRAQEKEYISNEAGIYMKINKKVTTSPRKRRHFCTTERHFVQKLRYFTEYCPFFCHFRPLGNEPRASRCKNSRKGSNIRPLRGRQNSFDGHPDPSRLTSSGRLMIFLPFGEMEVPNRQGKAADLEDTSVLNGVSSRFFPAKAAGQPQRSFDRRAFEKFHPRLGGEAAKVAREGATDQGAGLEYSSGCHHWHRAFRPAGSLEQSGGQVGEVAGRVVAQMARHEVAFAGRLHHQRKERGDLLGFELSGNDLGDLPKVQMLADPVHQDGVRAAPVKCFQRRAHGLAAQFVAGAAIVKGKSPAAGTQQPFLLIPREGDGTRGGEGDDGVRSEQIVARGNVPPHPGQQGTVYGSPIDPRDACADTPHHGGARSAGDAWGEPGLSPCGAEGFQDFTFGSAKPHFEGIGGPGLSARQELACTVREPRRRPRAAAVNSQKAIHRTFSHQRSAFSPILSGLLRAEH